MTEDQRSVNVVGVRFSPTGKVSYFDPGGTDPAVGDRVIVEGESGPQEGTVVIAPDQVLYSELRGPFAPVLRRIDADEGR